MNAAHDWGPWDALIDRCERLGRLRSLQALTHAFFGKDHPLIRALFRAESQRSDDLRAAACELDRVPSRDRRKILATYASLVANRAQESARLSQERSRDDALVD
jgi:hypothetical protein